MKSSQFKVALAVLLSGFILAGCYNPKSASVGSSSAAQTGGARPPTPELVPINTATVPALPPRGNAPSAVLRVGDMLTIDWFDTPTLIPQYKERIREDGKLILPLNVTVQAAGRTLAQLQDDIRHEYVPRLYNHLTISVKTDERVYYVGGEVKIANRLLYQDGLTVLRAIDTAGGFTDFANRNNIELRRQNGEIVKVNWKKAMRDPKLDPPIYPNDQVIVHKRSF